MRETPNEFKESTISMSFKWGLTILTSLLILVMMAAWSGLNARIGKAEDRAINAESRLSSVDAKIIGVDQRLTRIENKIDSIGDYIRQDKAK